MATIKTMTEYLELLNTITKRQQDFFYEENCTMMVRMLNKLNEKILMENEKQEIENMLEQLQSDDRDLKDNFKIV